MRIAIAVFGYRRLPHLRRCLSSIEDANRDTKFPLHIFLDGYQGTDDAPNVSALRQYTRLYQQNRPLLIEIIERPRNIGLKHNIISGLNQLATAYDAFIVLEEDILISRYFLEYAKDCLTFYSGSSRIWHINGYTELSLYALGDTVCTRAMRCWGWATWSSKWTQLNTDLGYILSQKSRLMYYVNIDGTYDYWRQLTLNQYQKLNTWAIFWYLTIAMSNGLCLSPTRSLCAHTGNDGTGTNVALSDYSSSHLSWDRKPSCTSQELEDIDYLKALKIYLRQQNKLHYPSPFVKFYYRLKRFFLRLRFFSVLLFLALFMII